MADGSERERDVARFNAFTDGVMVVSMTLLILNVQLPDSVKGADGLALWQALGAIWPNLVGYLISFLVIAQYWIGYTDYFGGLKRVDNGFIWLNVLFLLSVGFIPFVTGLLADNDGWLATTLYAITMIVAGGLMVVMARYATGKGLLDRRLPGQSWLVEMLPWFQIIAVFGLSIVVAQVDFTWAKLVWLILAAPRFHAPRRTL